MADIGDIQETFDSRLFVVACHDVARIVSILSFESEDIARPRNKNSFGTNVYEKSVFFMRFFYLVFYKGFTPTVFDMIPYRLWQALTIGIYVYRLTILPIWLRLTGYGRYTSWTNPQIGSSQPVKGDPATKPYKLPTLAEEGRLARVDFGDVHFETFITALYKKGAHLSPHSQSPGHPFVAGFPGNFMDHLTGVYKILVAWKQPQYVVRAGLFHSVYGTFDYRASFFDLRKGRHELQNLIGPAAEELSFAICTSDRLGLNSELMKAMYGDKASFFGGEGTGPPQLVGVLTSDGFPVRNHITQTVHVLSADLFAQFVIVMIADFMDQGVVSLSAEDADICIFHFLRYRFYSDLIQFVKPFLRVVPDAFERYMGTREFVEPKRSEVLLMKRVWFDKVLPAVQGIEQVATGEDRDPAAPASLSESLIFLSESDKLAVATLVKTCPYMAEPMITLACSMTGEETYEGFSRQQLARMSAQVLEDWGMTTMKKGTSLKDVLHLVRYLIL